MRRIFCLYVDSFYGTCLSRLFCFGRGTLKAASCIFRKMLGILQIEIVKILMKYFNEMYFQIDFWL